MTDNKGDTMGTEPINHPEGRADAAILEDVGEHAYADVEAFPVGAVGALDRAVKAVEAMEACPLDAIENVLGYCMRDEFEDYQESIRLGNIEEGDPAHIYTQLKRVSAWFDSQDWPR